MLDTRLFPRKRVKYTAQSEVAECGLACIAMVAGFHGLKIGLGTLICPPLSGPETMIVRTTKGTMNAEQEAQAGRDYRQAA